MKSESNGLKSTGSHRKSLNIDIEIEQLKLGQRRVARKDLIPLNKLNKFCKNWKDMGFYYAVYPAPYFLKPDGANFQFSPDGDHITVFVGKTPEDAVEGMFTMWRERMRVKPDRLPDVSDILGYPYCCTTFYDMLIGDRLPFDAYVFAAINTKNNFSSFLNPAARLIAHFPCSFDCSSSIRMATNFLNHLKSNFPAHANRDYFLKKPVHIFKTGQIVIFNECLNEKRLDFTNAICQWGPLTGKFKTWLEGAATASVSGDGKSLIRQDGLTWNEVPFLVLNWEGSLIQPREYLESICRYDVEERRSLGDIDCYHFIATVKETLKIVGIKSSQIKLKSFDFKIGVSCVLELFVSVHVASIGKPIEVLLNVYPPDHSPSLGAEFPDKIKFSISEKELDKLDPENLSRFDHLMSRKNEG